MARDERQHPDKPAGTRSPAQRDRDRLLYSSAFRRLAGVTQVVLPGGEPILFHNRLTHSIKVAQVARRLAESLGPTVDADRVAGRGCDADVVEAASLAHDMGHPPFGHVAEWQLDSCVRAVGGDGFEGNAQTFRILTRLGAVQLGSLGLNLTKATLGATIKYPWYMDKGPIGGKWGAYSYDSNAFEWVEAEFGEKTLEAEIMDWADDITYAVHDVEDFFRSGFIPLDRFVSGAEDLDKVLESVRSRWQSHLSPAAPSVQELEGIGERLRQFPLQRPFSGWRSERAELRAFTSALVNDLVTATIVSEDRLSPDRGAVLLVGVLKELTRSYVIQSPRLATQQHGQKTIIRSLFDTYFQNLSEKGDLVPGRWREEAEPIVGATGEVRARFVADVIASMTEEEATRTHERLSGIGRGVFLDPVIS